jgi:ElaB/YqjD/DUF883 family membrane-anchored ribosome-binding protein
MADATNTDLTKTLKDAAYIAVGFGVLAWNKAQVRRREIEKQLGVSTSTLREQLAKVAGEVEERFEPVVEAVEASLDQLEERLPEQAREVFKQARTTAKEAGEQVRSRLAQANGAPAAA